jgi:cell division protein FtsB
VIQSSPRALRVEQEEGFWHALNRCVSALIIFTGLVLAVCAFLPELRRQRVQTDRLEELRAEIARKQEVVTRAHREIELLKNEPAYVEVVARDRLDLMKEGETIFRFDPPPADTSRFRLNR